MKARVLFIGDANIDIQMLGLREEPRPGLEIFCDGFARAAGGSTALSALVYARLGGSAAFCGLVGDDEDGRFIASRFSEAGVDLSLLRFGADSSTGVTVNLVRGASRSQISYSGSLARMDESANAEKALRGFSHIHSSGVYGTPAFLPRLGGLMEAARKAGIGTSLDTQWDPTERWEHLEGILPFLDRLFVNEEEAISIARRLRASHEYGTSQECGPSPKGGCFSEDGPSPKGHGPSAAAAAWAALAQKTAYPIVKLGPLGAYAEGRAHPSLRVACVDTTGAGDSFAAGYLFARIELGLESAAALRYAAATGALACSYPGGDDPAMSRAAVEKLLAQA